MNATTVSRRTLAQGVGWSVPVLAVGATVPAMAASVAACPVIPAGTGWTLTSSGSFNTTPVTNTSYFVTNDTAGQTSTSGTSRNASGTGFQTQTDNSSATAGATITVLSPLITIPANTSFDVGLIVRAQYGYNGNGHHYTSLSITTPGIGLSFDVTTDPNGTGVKLSPAAQTGYSAGTGGTTRVTSTSAARTFRIQYVFTYQTGGGQNNDDFRVFPTVSNCTTP